MAGILSSHWPCLYVKPLATGLIPRAPSAQLGQDVRVTTFTFGCRLPFAMQSCSSSITPASCQLACHPVCGVVPLDDTLAILQKSNFGSHLWNDSLGYHCEVTSFSAPTLVLGQYGAVRSGKHGGSSCSCTGAVLSAGTDKGSYRKPVLLLCPAICSWPLSLFSILHVQVKDPDWGLNTLTSKQNTKHKNPALELISRSSLGSKCSRKRLLILKTEKLYSGVLGIPYLH